MNQNKTNFYPDRETRYEFRDLKTGELRRIFSNYMRYDVVGPACGYQMADEGKTWKLEGSVTYGVEERFTEGYINETGHAVKE